MCVRLSARIGETFRCASLVCRLDERSPDFEVHDVIVFERSTKRQTSFFKALQNLDRRARVIVCFEKRATRSGGSSPLFSPASPMLTPSHDPLSPRTPNSSKLSLFQSNSIPERRELIDFSSMREERAACVVVLLFIFLFDLAPLV